jgi:hypothetical protein
MEKVTGSNREQQGATGGNRIGRENQQSRISDQSPKIKKINYREK